VSLVEAYAWLQLGLKQGNREAAGLCEDLKKRMTDAEIASAMERSTKLLPKTFTPRE
jgi:hypothetical protein